MPYENINLYYTAVILISFREWIIAIESQTEIRYKVLFFEW